MRDKDLVALLHSCRLQNGRSNITGMLLYKDGHFMQVLEGEKSMIMKVFSRISTDSRHDSVDILRAELIQHRDFPSWTMGFKNIDEVDPVSVLGYTRFLDFGFRSPHFSENTVEAHFKEYTDD